MVMGHRGSRAARSENTLAAFEHAAKVGADVVEFDLVVTKDDRLVVNHDVSINNENCFIPGKPDSKEPIPIRTLTFDQVRQYDCGTRKNPSFPKQVPVPGARIPSFEEALELLKPMKVDLMIETKMAPPGSPHEVDPKHFVELLYRTVSRYGIADRVILQSFDHRALREMRKLDPKIRLCMLNPARRLPDYIGPAKELGAAIQFINFRVIQPNDVEKLHAAGLKIFSGTTDDPSVWKKLADAKVDGILTDDPKALVDFLRSR